MSRRLWLASAPQGGGTVTPPPNPDPVAVEPTIPYSFPTAAPWNAPTYAVTPTPDGTGSAVHPSVLDFGGNPWNGHRFWMAYTPYYGSVVDLENPCIAHSDDGYTWTVPAGLTNPIAPDPAGANTYNSDTELVLDPATNRLICFWREINEDTHLTIIRRLSSGNGSTWDSPGVALSIAGVNNLEALSPAIRRKPDGTAEMYVVAGVTLTRFTAPSLTGTFGNPTELATPGASLWHVGVTTIGTTLYALFARTSPWDIYAAKSTDGGLNWVTGSTPVMQPNTSNWDSNWLYRATLTPHQNGTHMRVWYSSLSLDGPTSWRIGYTRIPLSAWPT